MMMMMMMMMMLVLLISKADGWGALEPGFEISPLSVQGLQEPVRVAFDSSNRMYVLERGGRIKRFLSVNDAGTGTVICDLSNRVYSWWDHGMLSMALHPAFASNGRIYVHYTTNRLVNDQPTGFYGAQCPDSFCVSSARLSRLTIDPVTNQCGEEVLVAAGCTTSSTHHVGDLFFGAQDGWLYFLLGDGGQFNYVDDGHLPDGTAEYCLAHAGEMYENTSWSLTRGGSWRSQFDEVPHGKLMRIQPDFILPAGYRPEQWKSYALLTGSSDASKPPFRAKGFRNPFRAKQHPASGDVFVADVGWGTWESLWRVGLSANTPVNQGWPCREGGRSNQAYVFPGNLCDGPFQMPWLAYHHSGQLGSCPRVGSSSITAVEFYQGAGNLGFPAAYQGALFLADFSRNCMWFVRVDPATGQLEMDPQTLGPKIRDFDQQLSSVVDLRVAPDGSLLAVRIFGEIPIFRIAPINPAQMSLQATPTTGQVPLAVTLRLTLTGNTLNSNLLWRIIRLSDNALVWQLTTNVAQLVETVTLGTPAQYAAQVQLVDQSNGNVRATSPSVNVWTYASALNQISLSLQSVSPMPWSSGQWLSFTAQLRINGQSVSPGTAPAQWSRVRWVVELLHCVWNDCLRTTSDCHVHPLTDQQGGAVLSMLAPSHPYPSYVRISLWYAPNVTSEMVITPNPLINQWLATAVMAEVRLADQTASWVRDQSIRMLLGEEMCIVPCRRANIMNSSLALGAPSRLAPNATSFWDFVKWDLASSGMVVSLNPSAVVFPSSSTAMMMMMDVVSYRAHYTLRPLASLTTVAAPLNAQALPEDSCQGVVLSWNPVNWSGGSITDYLVQYRLAGGSTNAWSFTQGSTYLSLSHLGTGQSIEWRVAAVVSCSTGSGCKVGLWSSWRTDRLTGDMDGFWCPLECPIIMLQSVNVWPTALSLAATVDNSSLLAVHLDLTQFPNTDFQVSLSLISLLSGLSFPSLVWLSRVGDNGPCPFVFRSATWSSGTTAPWNENTQLNATILLSPPITPPTNGDSLICQAEIHVRRAAAWIDDIIPLQMIFTSNGACVQADRPFGCVASLDPLPTILRPDTPQNPTFQLNAYFYDPLAASRVLMVELMISGVWYKVSGSANLLAGRPSWQTVSVTIPAFLLHANDLPAGQTLQWHIYFIAPGATWDTRQKLWTQEVALIAGSVSASPSRSSLPSPSPSRSITPTKGGPSSNPSPSPLPLASWPADCLSIAAGCVYFPPSQTTTNFILIPTQPDLLVSGVMILMNGPANRDLMIELMQKVTWNKFASLRLPVAPSSQRTTLNSIALPLLTTPAQLPLVDLEIHFYFVPSNGDWTQRNQLFALPITVMFK